MLYDVKKSTIRIICIILALLFCTACAQRTQPLAPAPVSEVKCAQPTTQPTAQPAAEQFSPKLLYKPTPSPDRIILTWQGDPSTSQAVTWRTDETVEKAFAQIAEANDGPKFTAEAIDFPAKTSFLMWDDVAANYHSVNFTHLSPKTKYVYRVGDGNNFSEWNQFTAASDKPEPFTFIYLGDMQNHIRSHCSRTIRQAYSDAPNAAFMIHAGDLVGNAGSDLQWGEWFYTGGFINRMIPSIAAPGNHERVRVKMPDGRKKGRLTPYWQEMFEFPLNGPEGLEESAYWLDYQGVRFIVLNSNRDRQKQRDWLQQVLSANNNRWTIITFHHPIYSTVARRDNAELRNLWQPVFDKYHVDLVLQGHDHTYARSGLKVCDDPNLAIGRNDQAGTVYVVSVAGPKMYKLRPRRPWMRRVAEVTQLYQIIKIDADHLHYQARTATGRLYDAFTLRKRPSLPNELIEKIPHTPERLRPTPKENK